MNPVNDPVTVLVADSNEADRARMTAALEGRGWRVIQAIDGGTAVKVVEEHAVDIAVFDHHMTPRTGFDFARHIGAKGYDIGMVMVTDDPSTDLLLQAGKLRIKQLLRKPVEPDRLVETVRRVLRAHGRNPDGGAGIVQNLASDPVLTPADLMRRAIALAQQNAHSRMGGPFGAVVADAAGHVVGEGVNAVTARRDPTAHAEVTAIRRATDKLNRIDLSDCTIYCSSEPTLLGEALIIGTGIKKVFYALSHEDGGFARTDEAGILGEAAKPLSQRRTPHEQLCREEALAVVRSWRAQDGRVSD